MSGIGAYLKHTISIVRVTMLKGVRSETITSDVPAFISQKTIVLRDESGDHFGVRDILFLKGDITLNEIDEIIVDGKQRPIVSIFRVRTKSNAIHHLEVEVR